MAWGTDGASWAKTSSLVRIAPSARSVTALAMRVRMRPRPASMAGSNEMTTGRTSPVASSAAAWSATNLPAKGSSSDGYQLATTSTPTGVAPPLIRVPADSVAVVTEPLQPARGHEGVTGVQGRRGGEMVEPVRA